MVQSIACSLNSFSDQVNFVHMKSSLYNPERKKKFLDKRHTYSKLQYIEKFQCPRSDLLLAVLSTIPVLSFAT